MRLPHEDASWWEEEKDQIPSRSSTRNTRYTVDVPKVAIAGLVGDMDEHLEDLQDHTPRVVPASAAWTTSGDIYIGCNGGQLLRVCIHFTHKMCIIDLNYMYYYRDNSDRRCRSPIIITLSICPSVRQHFCYRQHFCFRRLISNFAW